MVTRKAKTIDLKPTELRISIYAHSDFASGELLAFASIDLRSVAQQSFSRDENDAVQLPPDLVSWCSIAEVCFECVQAKKVINLPVMFLQRLYCAMLLNHLCDEYKTGSTKSRTSHFAFANNVWQTTKTDGNSRSGG